MRTRSIPTWKKLYLEKIPCVVTDPVFLADKTYDPECQRSTVVFGARHELYITAKKQFKAYRYQKQVKGL